MQSVALESSCASAPAKLRAIPRPASRARPAELNQWLRILLTEHASSGAPFSVVHFEVEGVERISAGYGENASWRMMAAVAAVVSGSSRARSALDGRGPARGARGRPGGAGPDRARGTNRGRRRGVADRPRAPGSTAGIAECPTHGTKADELLGAEEAAWAARAGGEVAVLAKNGSLQDP